MGAKEDLQNNLADIQGNVVRGYRLPFATYLFFRIENAFSGRAWLNTILEKKLITNSSVWNMDEKTGTVVKPLSTVNLALSYAGLKALGVSPSLLASFPVEFKEGMARRSTILGDTGPNDPQTWEHPFRDGLIHVLVIINAQTNTACSEKVQEITRFANENHGVVLEGRQEAGILNQSDLREHFGYRDGISQPYIEGTEHILRHKKAFRGQGTPTKDGKWNPLKAGEFILGYEDEGGYMAGSSLPPHLSKNGTFLVFRKLAQNVPAFRGFLRDAAKQVWGSDESEGQKLLAAKIMGRWQSGCPLAKSPDKDDEDCAGNSEVNNDFLYADDVNGEKCPLGSHIRRNNPRDSLSLGPNNRHRIMRRGITYGPLLPSDVESDTNDRGVIFMAINASISRQFEFLQQQWVNKGEFLGLDKQEKDPIIGSNNEKGKFTIPGAPVPFTYQLQDFVTTRGGDYFFLPGIQALKRLATVKFAGSFLSEFYELSHSSMAEDKLTKAKQDLLKTWIAFKYPYLYKELRENQPVFQIPGNQKAKLLTLTVVTKHRDVQEVLEHDKEFTVDPYAEKMASPRGPFILGMGNSSNYQKELSILQSALRREDLPRIKRFITQSTERIIKEAITRGSGKIDVVEELSRAVPTLLLQDYFGIRDCDQKTLRHWMRMLFWDIFLNFENNPSVKSAAEKAAGELSAHLDSLISSRKSSIKAGTTIPDDMLSRLVDMQVKKNISFKDIDIRRNIIGVIVGVVETTSKSIVYALEQLVDRPSELSAAQKAAREGHDELVENYVFEAMRFKPQNHVLLRLCKEAYQIAKATDRETVIPPNSLVFAATQSAMFDSEVFEDPDQFRPGRPRGIYLFYGQALHTCLGRYISDIQIPEVIKHVLKLKGLYRVSGTEGQIQHEGPFPNSFILGFHP